MALFAAGLRSPRNCFLDVLQVGQPTVAAEAVGAVADPTQDKNVQNSKQKRSIIWIICALVVGICFELRVLDSEYYNIFLLNYIDYIPVYMYVLL